MSIKIEIEAASGADLRKEMLDLLGINAGIVVGNAKQPFAELSQVKDEGLQLSEGYKLAHGITEAKETTTAPVEEAPKPEQTTRKRRTKAEIEAEAAALAANTGTEEPPASTENVETPAEDNDQAQTLAQDNAEQNAITAEDLTKKCVELGRGGKRDAVLAVFESQFGGATISKKDGKPQLTVDQYPAVMEALNAIA